MSNTKNYRNILVIHGPNLNMLGTREPETYGGTSLDEINRELMDLGKTLGMNVDVYQSNHEGEIVEKIQSAVTQYSGLIINPAAYTHTSVAIRDAILLLDFPIIEIHISNVYKREEFRHESLISDVVHGKITGFGAYGYQMALNALARMENK